MTIDVANVFQSSIQETAAALRDRLQRYIEAAYAIRDTGVVEERRALLQEIGTIAQQPFLETTPTYASGSDYGKLNLPQPIGETLIELATWNPGIGVFARPYLHQAEALHAFFCQRHDLVVATGTGSGKTETFLLPMLGQLLDEASNRPQAFRQTGCRAWLLYPMNALVSDQIARLRRLFGDERLRDLFRERYGRFPRFGMYTSRTPYPGERNASRDKSHLDPLLRYYLDLEDAAQKAGDNSQEAQLVHALKERGRWPAKDLRTFAGKPGSRWEQRLRTQPGDRELLTRHEIQQTCPDILVTNYSMLEYMLMRPIERTIFQQTRDWLNADSQNTLLLVVDEAHLYRGTAGAEVGYLIRRLQARLEIPRSRMRCILTSASLGPEEAGDADAIAFAEALTGSPGSGGRSFCLIHGSREHRPESRVGTVETAAALAHFDQTRFARRAEDPEAAISSVGNLAALMNWPAPPANNNDTALRHYLAAQLYGCGPIEHLIVATTGKATAFDDLARQIFPDAPLKQAYRATETLLTLGTYAHDGQRPFLQTRVHLLFRGLPSLYACINPRCDQRRHRPGEELLLGRLYTEPRTHCTCSAHGRVYEVVVHRDCGAAFVRVFGEDEAAQFYWHEQGGRITHVGEPLMETWLVLERPHPDANKDVEPIWIDIATGRVETDPPSDTTGYRQVWRPTSGVSSTGRPLIRTRQRDEEDDEDSEAGAYPLDRCPICTKKSPDKILDLATRGERPFANLVHKQFMAQIPAHPLSDAYPNGGRKVLLFSDGRQKAARLARDLPREVEFDTFRQALVVAIKRLSDTGNEVKVDENLYTAFVAVCHDLYLHFFDTEHKSQESLLRHIQEYRKYSEGDLVLALDEPFKDFPLRYRQALLDQLSNPFYAVYKLGVMVVQASRSSITRIRRQIKTLPDSIHEQHLEAILTAWIQELLERAAFDKGLDDYPRKQMVPFAKRTKTGAKIRSIENILGTVGQLTPDQIKQLRTVMYDVLTDQDNDGNAYLKPSALTLRLAFDDIWLQCATCGNLQHQPLLGRCAACGRDQLVERLPTDPYMSAHYDYFREPLRAALHGERPTHITAEEHTAQLSQRDTGEVYATTEEFELRFQDVALSDAQPPIDVLSCTTTMEVGIDIGSLTAIGMRNVPPQRENYQQRAGRAGRRGATVSTVVTYADNGPHDNFYYHHPAGMISGDPRRPVLKIDSRRLAQRHLNAYLLQTFFHTQIDQLHSHTRDQILTKRKHLFTALGTVNDFFADADNNPLSFNTFKQWVAAHIGTPGDAVSERAVAWLPDEIFDKMLPDSSTIPDVKKDFVVKVAEVLVQALDNINETRTDEDAQKTGLLDTLFDQGLLPSYAFPTDVVSFYVFGRDGERVIVKERPQQSKERALSEYAPGRLLVVNKETYRVGGIYVERASYKKPAAHLFEHPLAPYVFCPNCTYVRMEPLQNGEHCPICQSHLEQREMLDPPGFAPEQGRPLEERDRDQEMSYATGAQLPTPVATDQMDWHEGSWSHLRYTYAENLQFVVVNKGPDEEGFAICEECGAAWSAANAPKSTAHPRPFLIPDYVRSSGSLCRGIIHNQPIYLGTTFRSDLLLLRLTLRSPIDYNPQYPWFHDALRTTAEALALAASRILDVDPAELSAGYRLLPPDTRNDSGVLATVDFYLFDTAAGGAGYAAEAATELAKILTNARTLVEDCPGHCERSCTRCMRHYGNRFWHTRLDRHLAAQILRYVMEDTLPIAATMAGQRKQLAPLRRYLELEGWQVNAANVVDDIEIPLCVTPPAQSQSSVSPIIIGTYPVLVDRTHPEFSHPLNAVNNTAKIVLVRDYIATRDLPTVYQEVRRTVGTLS
jgi:ATP-dependent helicase YprA (DUF1998 family)